MKISKELYASYTLVNLFLFCSSTYFCKIFWPHFDELFAFALHKMDSDEENFPLSGLTAEVRGLKGGLKHRNMKRKRVEHHINEECPSRCLVRLCKKYMWGNAAQKP